VCFESCKHGSTGGGWKRTQPVTCHAPARQAHEPRHKPYLASRLPDLKRETWGQMTSEFDLDHFEPQSLNRMSRTDYLNLVYACRRCNAVKGDQTVADPFRLLRSTLATVLSDGSLRPHGRDTQRLILQLDLNSPRLKSWRAMWMRILDLARTHDPGLYFKLVGFPEDLPDLSRLRPPRNARKGGLKQSWSARRRRGSLPPEY
jgi:hypothetical protein